MAENRWHKITLHNSAFPSLVRSRWLLTLMSYREELAALITCRAAICTSGECMAVQRKPRARSTDLQRKNIIWFSNLSEHLSPPTSNKGRSFSAAKVAMREQPYLPIEVKIYPFSAYGWARLCVCSLKLNTVQPRSLFLCYETVVSWNHL